jgi:hemerythrin
MEVVMKQTHRSFETAHEIAEASQLHPACFAELARLPSMPDGEFVISFDLFVATLEGDLRVEEQWMEDIDFPAIKEHRALHAEVLGVLHKAQARAMAGDLALARRAVELLPEWLADHVSTMDVPLAAALRVAVSRKPQSESLLNAA